MGLAHTCPVCVMPRLLTLLHALPPTCLVPGPQLAAGDTLDGWESILFHARHLQRCAEDLGAALYPPQV